MQKIKILVFILAIPFLSMAQESYSFNGRLLNKVDNQSIPNASLTLVFQDTVLKSSTDIIGKFSFIVPSSFDAYFHLYVKSFNLYDSILITPNTQKEEVTLLAELKEISKTLAITEINEKVGIFKHQYSVENMEVLGRDEITRGACCNLGDALETNATIDVAISDAVLGKSQIQVLGLDGIYTQLLADNVPLARGLISSLGVNEIPGSYIESIQIAKGAGSVVNGYESMTGQINLTYYKPENMPKHFLDFFVNTMGRTELSYNTKIEINDRFSTALLLKGSQQYLPVDMNNDNFLDAPLGYSFNIGNLWEFQWAKNIFGEALVSFDKNNIKGGEIEQLFDPNLALFDLNQDFTKAYFYLKTGYVHPEKSYKSFGVQTSGSWFNQSINTPFKNYDGTQTYGYLNTIYMNRIANNQLHSFKTGASVMYDNLNENLNEVIIDTNITREELVAGIYGEYSFHNFLNTFNFTSGLRLDNSSLFGWFLTPRIHTRYQPFKKLVLKASVGKGYRTPNQIVENSAVMFSNRTIELTQDIQQEESWNMGGTAIFTLNRNPKKSSVLSVDYYYTTFQNQLIADVYQSARLISLYYLDGISFSHALQGEWSYSPVKSFNIRTALKWYNSKADYRNEGLEFRPLTPIYRGLITAGYTTKYEKYNFDITYKHIGVQQLPNTQDNPLRYQLPEMAEAFNLLNFQIKRNFKKATIYFGVDNVFNLQMERPIVASDEPYGTYFDATMAYAPSMGRRIFAGYRYTIK
jgi:hypothetical protein